MTDGKDEKIDVITVHQGQRVALTNEEANDLAKQFRELARKAKEADKPEK